MAVICTECGKPTQAYHMCDEDDLDVVYCGKCFDKHPCGMGRHGEGCPTNVFDSDPEVINA